MECRPCKELYDPNPDIAGQAVYISFLVHTCIFIILALIVNPIVRLYLGIAKNDSDQPEDPELQGGEPLLQEITGHSQETTRRGSGQSEFHCREAIHATYTSQHIAGLAFLITAFAKHGEISYYHLRVILSVISMHSTMGMMSNYERQSVLSFGLALLSGRVKNKKLKLKMMDIAFSLNVALHLVFTVFVFTQRQRCFGQCYPKDSITYWGSSWAWLGLLIISIHNNGNHSPLGYAIFAFCVSGYVAFQSWQFRSLTQTFRPVQVAPGVASEEVFSFGQILVLFMIVPLISDYMAALLLDIGRIQRLAGEAEPHTVTFITLFRVLLPWFANRVLTDFAQLISETLAPLLRRVAAPISSVPAAGRTFILWVRTTFAVKRKLSIFERTNTSQLERGQGDSGQTSMVDLNPTKRDSENDTGNDAGNDTGNRGVVSTSVVESSPIQTLPPVRKRSTYPLP